MLIGDKYTEFPDYLHQLFFLHSQHLPANVSPSPSQETGFLYFWQEPLFERGWSRGGVWAAGPARGVPRWENVPVVGMVAGFQLALPCSSSSRHPFHAGSSRWASPSTEHKFTFKTNHRLALLLFFSLLLFLKFIRLFLFVYLVGFFSLFKKEAFYPSAFKSSSDNA